MNHKSKFKEQLGNLEDTPYPVLYEGSNWGARLCLTEAGAVYVTAFNMKAGTNEDIYHGRTRSWELPSTITGHALRSLLLADTTLTLLSRVYDGLSADHNFYSNLVGVLTEDAKRAEDELTAIIAAIDEKSCTQVSEVRDWLSCFGLSELWLPELTLEKVEERIRDAVDVQGIFLRGSEDLKAILLEWLLFDYGSGYKRSLSPTQRQALLADAESAKRLAEIEESVSPQ